MSSVPVIFKKYLSYTEIGVLMMCTVPFSLKVLWSPIVEFYTYEPFGKRKSWIIPTQLIMCAILYYLSYNLEPMLMNKEVETVSYLLTGLIFVITCQDIAVDSWAIEMLHPVNAPYGSSSQTIGHKVGTFISTSIFISMNTPEFCRKWLGTESNDPLWTVQNFLFYYSIVQFVVTIYVAFFVLETKIVIQHDDSGQANPEVTISQTFAIFKDLLMNKNLQLWFVFHVLARASICIDSNVSEVYLTNDLGFAKENLSIIKVVCTPFNIVAAMISGYLSASDPFRY